MLFETGTIQIKKNNGPRTGTQPYDRVSLDASREFLETHTKDE